MESAAVNIGTTGLLLGYLLLIIPIALILYFRVRLLKDLTVSLLRMTVQLLFVGFYLQFVFDLNSWWLNILWLMVMISAADISLISASGIRLKRFLIPVFISLFIGTVIPLIYLLWVIIQLPNVLDARYFIPIAGMIMGNSLRADIVGLRSFYSAIKSNEKSYQMALGQSAVLSEAVRPHLKESLIASWSPTIATMATIGIVSLPGMMTGIILGGTDPMVAIKYQIAIMIAIFSGTALAVVLGIVLTMSTSFTSMGTLDHKIFKSK
ncbi:MAG: ABC transporter permease [Candidatus Aminicenantes bacterium]|nr:ABC transporter permease [Candidatus Aminicenantes bacterium]